MSSKTYTLSYFTSICNASPEEVIAIINTDNWFVVNKTNPEVNPYILFKISNKKISFINCVNSECVDIMEYDYIKVDKNIKINELTIHTPLTIQELASVIFSVNSNFKAFNLLKNFFVNLKKNEPYNLEIIKSSNKMKCFCAHLTYLIANTSNNSLDIPDWLIEDTLISEEIKMYESIHKSKFKTTSIPSLDNYDKLFVSSMYLSFMIVYDKAKDMQSQYQKIPENVVKILKSLVMNLNKTNIILNLI